MNRFREALQARKDFVITCEHVPGMGLTGKRMDNILKFAEQAKSSRRIHALSLTDNAGGNPAFSADSLGFHLIAMGVDIIVHFSTKDMNRNAVQARAYALKKYGVTNLLVMSGDYPIAGFLGISKPVFDIDSVIGLHYLKKISEGLEATEGRQKVKLEGTNFFLGAVASPFKWTEASLLMQYSKLEKKIRAGADFIITQLGYDSRKYVEFIRFVRSHLGIDLPLLGSVHLLSAGPARFMNSGEVPGCYVSDRQLEAILKEAKGKAATLERAARQVAILRGLRYSGAHIGGLNLNFDDVNCILDRAEEIEGNWAEYLQDFSYAPVKPYYLFEGGEKFRVPEPREADSFTQTPKRPIFSLTFWAMRLLHKLFFIEDTLGYKLLRAISIFAEKRTAFFRLFQSFEWFVKKIAFDCMKCDDCALVELYYLCPESQCPKGMRIGACGGSRPDGKCEVYNHRLCIWERVYWRAKNRHELDKLRFIIAPRNWGLYETSSWINYYLKRDHAAVKLDIPAEVIQALRSRE